MDRARVIELLRELLEELEVGDAPQPEAPPPAPARRRAKAPSYPAPSRPVSDTDRARAKKLLRRRGIYT